MNILNLNLLFTILQVSHAGHPAYVAVELAHHFSVGSLLEIRDHYYNYTVIVIYILYCIEFQCKIMLSKCKLQLNKLIKSYRSKHTLNHALVQKWAQLYCIYMCIVSPGLDILSNRSQRMQAYIVQQINIDLGSLSYYAAREMQSPTPTPTFTLLLLHNRKGWGLSIAITQYITAVKRYIIRAGTVHVHAWCDSIRSYCDITLTQQT